MQLRQAPLSKAGNATGMEVSYKHWTSSEIQSRGIPEETQPYMRLLVARYSAAITLQATHPGENNSNSAFRSFVALSQETLN